jgi:hypothetical protein
MFRIILAFVLVFVLFYVSINLWRKATKRVRWDSVKVLTYSMFISILTLVTLSIFVVLF